MTADVVHVAATPLVWERCEYIWVRHDQGVHSLETGRVEVPVATYVTAKMPSNIQTSAIEH